MWGADKGKGFESYGKGKGKGAWGKGAWGKPKEEPTPIDLNAAIEELHTTCMDLMADDGMLMRAWNQVKIARTQQQQEQGITVTAPAAPAERMVPKISEPEAPLTREERKERAQVMINRMFELLKQTPGECMQADELLRDHTIREARKGVATYFKKWVQLYPETFRIDDPEVGKTQYSIALITPFAEPPEALDSVANIDGRKGGNRNKRPYNVAFTPPFGSF